VPAWGVTLPDVAVPPTKGLVERKTSLRQAGSLNSLKLTSPVGLAPPVTVAVSVTTAPSRLPGEVWVVMVGVAAGGGMLPGMRARPQAQPEKPCSGSPIGMLAKTTSLARSTTCRAPLMSVT
jgi:hypothetical protein